MYEDILNYSFNKILPKYNLISNGHGSDHIVDCLNVAESIQIPDNIDMNLLKISILWHDIGHLQNPKYHHQISAQMMVADPMISTLPLKILDKISMAVLQHRSSGNLENYSEYSSILRDIDTLSTSGTKIIQRALDYSKAKESDIEKIVNDTYDHIIDKYSENGYAFKSIQNKELFKDIILTQYKPLWDMIEKGELKYYIKKLI